MTKAESFALMLAAAGTAGARPPAGIAPAAASTDRRVDRMEAQLARWSARIDRLATPTESAGAATSIDRLQRLDELRFLRALARTRFDEFRTSEEERRPSLKRGVEQAWDDLAVAMKKERG